MNIHLKLYGVFRTATKTNEITVEIPQKNPTVRSVLSQLASKKEFESLKQLLLENATADPRPNALIMVSGREISALNGLETTVSENDELALLPIAHGG